MHSCPLPLTFFMLQRTKLSASMKFFFRFSAFVSSLSCLCVIAAMNHFGIIAQAAPLAVLTQHNDLGRTGANLNETVLSTNNLNTNLFGILYTRPVDDEIHTQPLIMTNAAISDKGTHNLVIVATVND